MAPKFSPAAALVSLLYAPSAIQSMLSMYPPFSSEVAKKAYSETPNLIPTPSELVGQRQKHIIDDTTFVNHMMEAGYSPKHAENMLANSRTYLAALDYITSWRRGETTEEHLNELLTEQGLNSEDIQRLKSVTIYYPTPQDIIRFAVRDVYTSTTIEQYGLFEDYPDLLDANAAKAGLPPEITKLYWGAHWELPSPTQVYDMYHRNIITEEEMKTYLKVADYMPFWRDKLIKLSFDPITRVDIRRMYELGVLSEDQVTRRYQDLGYSPEDASVLTQFTVLEAHKGDGSNASSVIIASYKGGSVDRATAKAQLLSAKVNEELADTLLDNADAAIRQELIDLEADAITDQYQRGVITLEEFQTQLTKIGVPARMLQLTIARELAQARKRAKTSTKSELESWWKSGVIGQKEFTVRMTALGYSKKDITLYLAELEMGDITGANKKFVWAEAFREFADGDILLDGLISKLNLLGIGPDTQSKLIGIAKELTQ